MRKSILLVGALMLAVSLSACTLPWQDKEPPYVWGEEVQSQVQEILDKAPAYNSSKADKAPLATQYSLVYFSALISGNTQTVLEMQGYQTNILNGVDYSTWMETAGYGYLYDIGDQEISISSEYEGSYATVSYSWGDKENRQTFDVTVAMDNNGFSIVPTGAGFREDYVLKLPATVKSINGQDFSDNLTEHTASWDTFTFEQFPICDITVKYESRFGSFTETVVPDDTGAVTVESVLTDERQIQEYVNAANTCINQLWHALWDDRSKESMMNILESEEVANALLYQLPDIHNKTITYVEVFSSRDLYPNKQDLVVSGDMIYLNLRYLTKFDISNGALSASMSSCKDFTWITLHQLEDGSWKIHDMGIEGRQSILTYLNYTNNEW